MVSIVSTAQASLLNEDAYDKKLRTNTRNCGVWGTAFCCLNLKGSVIVIAIIYGMMHIFSNIGILLLGRISHISGSNYGEKLPLVKNLLLFLINTFGNQLFGNINNSTLTSQIVVETKLLKTLLKFLEVSCYTNGIIFVFGMLTGILSWFWLTAILLIALWIESIKSISSIIYITYLLIFILKNWFLAAVSIFISVVLLLITYFFSYYSIQIVYSLYLVQLAGGRGNEYVAYYKLRRLFQNSGINKFSNSVTEKSLLRSMDESSSLIRANQNPHLNV
ncbi:uncharacterized protein cubi_01837 [Cryptosporidium ubiquitum]|uniref:Uncharacterized protein n=1 Tax=Cryptosporidium ubiquitum TaxID=857276 RepID=A0A1J4MQN6_9CRYT|nr:uncharacterized protein cubi_01837 [Cryptosporidium ubiquitum]OII75316.1 hypothetical protein cubi_01837 [Cryptosporidium ubiquitum]